MDVILPENVFDSRLDSHSTSATNLFACLAPENMTDNDALATFNNSDDNATNEQVDGSDTLTNVENAANKAQLTEPNGEELVQSGTEIQAEISSQNQVNEFVPTIIDIRGACNDSSDNLDTRESLQVDVTLDANVACNENENDATSIVENDNDTDVQTLSDQEETVDCDKANNKSVTDLNTNVVVKEEPRDEDNDCMLVDSDGIGTCFTSEIEIKEEKTHENNDNEVCCVETTLKIPQPIPIKIEANFESDKEVSASESDTAQRSAKEEEPTASTSSKAALDKSHEKPIPSKQYNSAYTCHLCNTPFQDHEPLNEHMKLHRNNSLIERYNKTYGNKVRKSSKYVCRTCGKRLSTGQSLTQHMMIHNNEKPHVCPICKKDFRHLSNFKMHVQKHKEEEELRRKQRDKQKQLAKKRPLPVPTPTPADRSVARSADFGRLVGPLFVKESLLKKSPAKEIVKPVVTVPKAEYRKPYESKYAKAPRNNSAKENLVYFKKMQPAQPISYDEKYSRARKFNDDIGDDVIPLKTFNNVENIVMNATKFVVKVDNLDPNLLKKKIKTPDISIDKSAVSVQKLTSDRKRRVQLSPSADGAKRMKLDDIENIIMDSGESTSAANEQGGENEPCDDFDLPASYYDDYDDDVPTASASDQPAGLTKQETLTDNELFELLNDDRECKENADRSPPTQSSHLVVNQSPKCAVSLTKSTPPKPSNVVVLKSTPPSAKMVKLTSPSPKSIVDPPEPVVTAPQTPAKTQSPPKVDTPPPRMALPSSPIKSIDLTNDSPLKKPPEEKVVHSIEDSDDAEEDAADKCDIYDNAFRNVAFRRLNLIRKKASQNGGKVENKFLLGPLFWRKALRKARRNQLTKEPAMSLQEAKVAYKRINAMKFGKLDIRRTNDPAKLQHRAELKLQYILGRIKVTNDISQLNLTGPLFWKRTLKLAGVHDASDLKRLLKDERLTIDDVEFVTTKVTEPVSDEMVDKSTSTSDIMNGDLTIVDDEKSTSIDNVLSINSNDSVSHLIPKPVAEEAPSSLMLSSLSSEGVKSPAALTGSDFLENIVAPAKPREPLTNGSHNSIVDGILNDDILFTKPILQKAAPATTPIIPKSSIQVLKTTPDSTKEAISLQATNPESILYDSLTKPKLSTSPKSNEPVTVVSPAKPSPSSVVSLPQQPKITALSSAPIRRIPNATTNRSLLSSSSTSWTNTTTPKRTPARSARNTKTAPNSRLAPAPIAPALPELDNRLVPLIAPSSPAVTVAPATISVIATDSTSHHQIEADSTTALEAAGNIILNVDSADFQLIADAKNENGQETNYVLVSDGSGGVQLIKEQDFRLLEDAGATSNASHYIVNMPTTNEENFANFDLASTNGEQLAYIQIEGGDFAALQFIQDGSAALEDPITAAADRQKLVTNADKNVTIGGTNYVIAADTSTDLNHIGKELSDFLHIDLALLKGDNHHDQT